MCHNFSNVASLRVVSVIYYAKLTGPRIYAIVYCQFPIQCFLTIWETGIITPFETHVICCALCPYVVVCGDVHRSHL